MRRAYESDGVRACNAYSNAPYANAHYHTDPATHCHTDPTTQCHAHAFADRHACSCR